MPRTHNISSEIIDAAREFVERASTADELRAAQSVLLPGLYGFTLNEAAQLIGRSRATIIRLQAKFKALSAGKEMPDRKWGGRRCAYLTLREEEDFLAGFLKEASEGGVLEVGKIKLAFEQKINRTVAKTTIYRMLARHGWRKITPRPRHPKHDEDKQNAFKKTAGNRR